MQNMEFKTLGVEESLCAKLQEAGIISATQIQQLVIPKALAGESILARGKTGSGKSLAYLIPTIQRLSTNKRALILAPTRELAQQIGEVCRKILHTSCTVIYGGVEYAPQREALLQNPQVVISTVGRLLDLMRQGVANISDIDIFILDEVDQMVDLGFRDDIITLSNLRHPSAQSLALSATLPEEVEDVISQIMACGYVRCQVEGESLVVDQIEQIGYYVSLEMMDQLLIHLLRTQPTSRGVIFTRSRKMADRLTSLLRSQNFSAEAMHSDRSQTAREHILSRFKSGETTLLVATDVIARGIDIENIELVYNYGLPLEAEQYIHRIGRTARAGGSGRSITLTPPEDKPLVDRVCKLMQRHISFVASHPYSTPAKAPQKKRRGAQRHK